MTILYFYQYFGTPKGGWSTRVYEMGRRWVAAGHEVTVVTSPYDKSDIQKGKGWITRTEIEGIRVIIINLQQSNKHSFLYRIYTFLGYSLLSTYFALRLPYDLAIASSGPISVGLPVLIARFFRRKKYVFEVRDLWPEGAIQLGLLQKRWLKNLAYWLEGKCYHYADWIITCSTGMSEDIQKRFPTLSISEIPNASDNALFEQPDGDFQLPDWGIHKKIFIYAGSLGLMDDCLQIVQAAHELQKRNRRDMVVVLLGTGKEHALLENYVAEHQVNNTFFLGLIPKKEVVHWLHIAQAALLVFKKVAVLDTSSPNKLFDYLAAGKPVIQTTQGWIKELIKEKRFGINVTPNNPAEMADAMELLADQETTVSQMSANAKYLAKTIFSRDYLSDKYLAILEKVNAD